jgi:hypothetical protein
VERLTQSFADDLRARLEAERALATDRDLPVPDVAGMAARCAELAPSAKAAGLGAPLAAWQKALAALAAEGAAQRDLLALLDADCRPRDDKLLAAFVKRHGGTRTAKDAAALLRR